MFAFLIVCLVLVLLFHFFTCHQYNWPGYAKTIDKIPGPRGLLYFGTTLRFCRMKLQDLLPAALTDLKTYGPTFRYWLSGVAVVVVADVDDVQVVLSSRTGHRKGLMYKNIRPWLGKGLLISAGEKWTRMRKILTPTFHFSILRDFLDVFNRNSVIMSRLIEESSDKNHLDFHRYLTLCALDNVSETAMGVSINAQLSQEKNDYVEAVFRFGEIVVERMFSPLYFTDRLFSLSSLGKEHANILKILHGFTKKLIADRKKLKTVCVSNVTNKINNNEDDVKLSVTNMYKKKISLLDMLLAKQEENALSDRDIREEVDTFLFAGHDTTSGLLRWALFELGHNQDIQDKVYEELQQIFRGSDRLPTYDDLMEMSYLKRVLLESLRLYPSAPVISRKFNEDIQLKNYCVPANTEVVLLIYHIHRNPDIYPNPELFDPDRFLPEAVEKRHPFAHIPFSAGQRNCIGQKFAMLEMLTMASTILRKYKVESLDQRESIKVLPAIILRPCTTLRWKISLRETDKSV